MTNRQENRMTMYEGLLTILQANSAKVQSVQRFSCGHVARIAGGGD